MSHHVLRDCEFVIDLSIVDLEFQSYEAGEDRSGTRLSTNRRCSFARCNPRNGQTVWLHQSGLESLRTLDILRNDIGA